MIALAFIALRILAFGIIALFLTGCFIAAYYAYAIYCFPERKRRDPLLQSSDHGLKQVPLGGI